MVLLRVPLVYAVRKRSDQRTNEAFYRQGLNANNVLLRSQISAVSCQSNYRCMSCCTLYRDGEARTVTDRMCAVARCYNISSKADCEDIFIVHDQKSSYRTPLVQSMSHGLFYQCPCYVYVPWSCKDPWCLCRARELSDSIKNILICVPKMSKGLTGLERHEGE